MKVLWFTNTPSLYDQGKHQYHGCGWIESLEGIVREQSMIELAIAFLHPEDDKKIIRDEAVYYPIKRKRGRENPLRAVLSNWRGEIEGPKYQDRFLSVVNDFKPDVIHVFGTEGPFALIQELTNIPVIAHLQGLIDPCLNTYFPIRYSKLDFAFSRYYLLKNLIGTSPAFSEKRFKSMAIREKHIFQKLNYVCGRTKWDHQMAKLFNPNIEYFHIDEVLRPVFYKRANEEKNYDPDKLIILSTLSPTVYKGIDVVLKTAKQLSILTNIKFEWKIIGLDDSSDLLKFFERKENIIHDHVGITLMGRMNADEIIDEMLTADIFVHPSYIDNSPNSVCEAQMIGLPVIACDVGGLSSLIRHLESGILVPSNGVYEICHYIQLLHDDQSLRSKIVEKGVEKARERHDKTKILDQLLKTYSEIIE